MLKTSTQIPFKDIAALWIKKKETSTKDSTYIHYYNLLKNHIEPKLGEECIEDITLLKLEKTIITFSNDDDYVLLAGSLLTMDEFLRQAIAGKSYYIGNIIKYRR